MVNKVTDNHNAPSLEKSLYAAFFIGNPERGF